MAGIKVAQPEVVSRAAWLTARKQLLAHEKELTRQRDALNRQRRELTLGQGGEAIRLRNARR